jgi:hypothetical protein
MLSLEIGKEFSAYLCCFFLFQGLFGLNTWRSIRAYTLHQYLSLFSLKRYFAKVATRSKRDYTLVDLPC